MSAIRSRQKIQSIEVPALFAILAGVEMFFKFTLLPFVPTPGKRLFGFGSLASDGGGGDSFRDAGLLVFVFLLASFLVDSGELFFGVVARGVALSCFAFFLSGGRMARSLLFFCSKVESAARRSCNNTCVHRARRT